MKQKGSACRQAGFIPILIIILLAAAALGGFLIYQNQTPSTNSGQAKPTPSPQPTTTQPSPTPTDETANWKTHTNTKYGYSLKNPVNYFISESNDPNGNIDTTTISNYDKKDFSSGKKNPDEKNVFLMWIRNPWQGGAKTIEEARSYYKNPSSKIEEYTVSGMTGFKVSTNGSYENYGVTVAIVRKQKEYLFELKSSNSQFANNFDQILSTFKFTQ